MSLPTRLKAGGRVVRSEWAALRKRLGEAAHSTVKAGVLGSSAKSEHGGITTVELAVVHEFGVPGHTPERSFVRSAFATHRQDYKSALKVELKRLYRGDTSVKAALQKLGASMQADIKNGIRARIPPPLSPTTVARKGSDVPLIDTGQLINSVHFEVEMKGGGHG